VWQHNVCVGTPEDEDDVPDHYFCEECRPAEHKETLRAMSEGVKIWERRNNIWKNEKKMSKGRKSKGKWLKKEFSEEEDGTTNTIAQGETEPQEIGTKRKRDSIKQEAVPEEGQRDLEPEPQATKPTARPDKRRKSSQINGMGSADAETALVDIDQLPADRKKVAEVLSKLISEDVQDRAKAGYRIPDGHTASSLGQHYGSRIEYSLHMNHGTPKETSYHNQFRMLNANLKRNRALIERLLEGSLTADELSTMESKYMASEEQMRENAKLKEELDRQAVAIEEEGPRIRRTHKGDEIIEDETHRATDSGANAHPVRDRMSIAEEGAAANSPPHADGQGYAGSPMQSDQPSVGVDTKVPPNVSIDRRTSSQQFDMKSIWEKTAQSPTGATAQPRPMQMAPRRRSSVQPSRDREDGAKHDPDVDRLLQDDDESYSPAEYSTDGTIVWRGKLVHSGEAEPTVNARFVAGRDLALTVPWQELLPEKMTIDGRLQVAKAEEYLCSLEWSSNSDVSVLAFTPHDDAEAFNTLFEYFHSRSRYAVVSSKDRPRMAKDLYIIPIEVGARLPDHVEKLEHCTIKVPVEERLLLATLVVARAPGTPQVATPGQQPAAANGQHHLPQHVRASGQGPSGSPINTHNPSFSPAGNTPMQQPPVAGYGTNSPFPPNAYGSAAGPPDPPQRLGQYPPPHIPSHPNPLVAEVLGSLQHAPTAQQVVAADPNITREKLENLRKILEEDPAARTQIEALAMRLSA